MKGLVSLCLVCVCVCVCVSGLPKAAVINQTRLLAALAVLASNGVTDTDVIYVTLPLYHTAGFLVGLMGSIETGVCVCVCVCERDCVCVSVSECVCVCQ